VNSKDKRGNTPLHFAANFGQLEVCRMLLERNAEVNSQNDEGLTPLHHVSTSWNEGSPDILRLLLDYGAGVLSQHAAE
jgi:ankyrin repeat protein